MSKNAKLKKANETIKWPVNQNLRPFLYQFECSALKWIDSFWFGRKYWKCNIYDPISHIVLIHWFVINRKVRNSGSSIWKVQFWLEIFATYNSVHDCIFSTNWFSSKPTEAQQSSGISWLKFDIFSRCESFTLRKFCSPTNPLN